MMALFCCRKAGETMAATRLIAVHINKGKTAAQSLSDRLDYSHNPMKTNDGEYVTGYECDPRTAWEEFLLTKESMSRKLADNKKVMCLLIRFASPSNRERLHQKKRTD